MACKTIRSVHRRLCVGDLEHLVTILDRNIVPPKSNSANFDMNFENAGNGPVWASIKTVKGVKMFDSTDVEQTVTHVFGFYWDDIEASEAEIDSFLYFDSRYFKILDIDSLDERKEWGLISCVERGSEAKRVNYA